MATVIQAQDKAGHYMKYDTKSKMRFILNYVHDPEKTNEFTRWYLFNES